MPNRIAVPLEIEDFDVLGTEVVEGVLEIAVSSKFPRACHHCGSVDVEGHGRRMRRIRDQSFGRPTVLCWSQRRFKCLDCHRTSRERHPALVGGRALTRRFHRHLFEQACVRPFSHVADAESVSQYRVLEAFDSHAERELAQHIQPPRVVSLDESSLRKRFRFHTVLSDPERGVILDMVEGRDKSSALGMLIALGAPGLQGIQTVVTDCFWPYRRAIEEILPNARLVVDKFHIVRCIDEAAQKVRRRKGRRSRQDIIRGSEGIIPRQNHPRNEKTVYQSRWVFMKRAAKLAEHERQWLRTVFDAVPEIEIAWLMKESFAAIYEAEGRDEAERRLDVWIHHTTICGMVEFANSWKTLAWWRNEILNYFDDRVTNGFAEGITNKIKVMKRSAYGFRCPMRYRRKTLLMSRRRRRKGVAHQKAG